MSGCVFGGWLNVSGLGNTFESNRLTLNLRLNLDSCLDYGYRGFSNLKFGLAYGEIEVMRGDYHTTMISNLTFEPSSGAHLALIGSHEPALLRARLAAYKFLTATITLNLI